MKSLSPLPVLAMLGSLLASPIVSADEEEKVCVRSNLVRSFDALTDEYILLEESSRNYFLVTMKRP